MTGGFAVILLEENIPFGEECFHLVGAGEEINRDGIGLEVSRHGIGGAARVLVGEDIALGGNALDQAGFDRAPDHEVFTTKETPGHLGGSDASGLIDEHAADGGDGPDLVAAAELDAEQSGAESPEGGGAIEDLAADLVPKKRGIVFELQIVAADFEEKI